MPPRDLANPTLDTLANPTLDTLASPSRTLDPIEDITRRQLLAALPALGLVAAGISCGDDDDGDAGAPPRTLEDAFGPVEVPANAERFVAGDEISFGNMLALGLQPLGGVWYSPELAGHLKARSEGNPVNLVSADEFDLEQALALDPDLIVTNDWDSEFCDRLKAASATYCYPYGYVTKEEIFGNLRGVARATGREAQADTLIGEYEARIAGMRAAASERGWDSKPVAIVYFNGGLSSMYVMGTGVATAALQDMGIPRAARTTIGEDTELSLERMHELDDAYALIAYGWGDGAWQQEIEASPVWQQLKLVQDGRVLWTDGPAWYGYDLLAVFAILDDIERQLLPLAEEE